MKKKIVAIMLAGALALSATACGGGSTDTGKSNDTASVENNKTETVAVPETKDSEAYFKDDVLKIDMATIKITGIEVAQPNTELGETNPSLVIAYDFTNDSDELIQAGTTWIMCFEATQETDATIDKLDVGMMPQDPKYAEMNDNSYTDVKPGATVGAVISYTINDPTKPVTLTATQGIVGEELGTKVINLQ